MEKKTALPKNVRQIGDILGDKRIYLEDYVVTYIHKKEKQEEKEGFLGILLGEVQKEDGETRLFIRGLMSVSLDRWAVKVEEATENQEMEMKEAEPCKDDLNQVNHISEKPEKKQRDVDKSLLHGSMLTGEEEKKNTEKRTRTILEECKDYFGEMEVIGCCVIGRYPVEPMKRLMEEVPQSRRLLYHLQDQEEHLYWTETGKYEEISGYFVFYEQNRSMQEYMAEAFHEKGEDKEKITDQAIKVFREKIKKKDQMNTAGMMKLASSFFVVTVLIIGALVVTRIGSIRDSSGNSGISEENTAVVSNGLSSSGNSLLSGTDGAADRAEEVEAGAAAEGEMTSGNVSAARGSAVTAGTAAVSGATDGESTVTAGTAAGSGATDGGSTAAAGTAAVSGATDGESTVTAGTAGESGATDEESAAAAGTAAVSGTMDVGNTVPDGTVATSGMMDTASSQSGLSENTSAVSGEAASGSGTEEDVEASAQIRQSKASYVIREGDTLADICQKYYGNLNKLEEICQENGIQDANRIMPGQKITLP